jgi:FlaA1/EpsC-like NDP-sugar epimerase
LDPLVPAMVHIDGTDNVLRFAPEGSRVVTASTCKSCDPETAYGASKLIAERMTLNAGHSVARFHNVVETSGNVFEIWAQRDTSKPLQVAPCRRYFISLDEAVACVLYAAVVERPGRFMTNPGLAHSMIDVARRVYPDEELMITEPRRGDRLNEPYFANSESAERETNRILRVYSPHDRVAA